MRGEERRKRKKGQTVERDGTREERPTDDWSDRVPEWYRARPISTVDHLLGSGPIHRSGPGPSWARSREDREILVDTPFLCSPPSLLSPLPFPFLVPLLAKRRMQTQVHGGRATIGQLSTRHLESGTSALLSRRKGERSLVPRNTRWRTVFLEGDAAD